MNYPLENLDPERFQQFCQALVLREHPNVQCFPVAQPDGGRDAVSYVSQGGAGKFYVFQVKFSRKPFAESNPQKWLLAIMAEEAPKVAKLIPHGASRFYLLTNIDGTAHLDSGSIDRLNQTFSENMDIPFMCWWRDDINRRLDNAWDLKWAYPDLMMGSDFLRAVLESGLREDRERRESAIRAFLAEQRKADEQVRFRQIDLQSNLLDLFIDVPISFREMRGDKRQARMFYGLAHTLAASDPDFASDEVNLNDFEQEQRFYHYEQPQIGAAALLLSRHFYGQTPRLVLEGAPGQGKSTIAQYVCQVHRLKLLNDHESLAKIPTKFKAISTRLPIKIDLRDFATWLGKKDPFDVDDAKAPPPTWRKTLESFIAALVSFQSGGTNFTTDDLLATARVSSILLVLDGLDEVADIARRHDVVEEITKGVQRLEANAASLQTVVTSRPAAFANSPGMPPSKYLYVNLASLSRSSIEEYADRWLKARSVDLRESAVFKKTLKEKLDQPHLRDLARNPMQLAILLSLILTRGTWLPDKRTALYDNYIGRFFSRESEKSAVVRKHRDLLIDIHRYLAWLLQSESERGNSRGSISQQRLQETVASYLSDQDEDTTVATELFTGMVERVVALVSRVEGTYEFEVQPLREYFAARFLYETAPYSPTGEERGGTKPDRFDAIAQNFYWTNVARFYAGCFSKGELPALAERLQELTSQDGFKFTSHPRMLAGMFLSDWVFNQNQRSVKQAVEVLLDGIGLRYLLASGVYGRRRRGTGSPLSIPNRCGREELMERCFHLLDVGQAPDYAREIIELAKANAANKNELIERWSAHFARNHTKAHEWLGYAVELGVLSNIDQDRLEGLLKEANIHYLPIGPLYRARRLDVLECSEQTFKATVDEILSRRLVAQSQSKIESALDALAHSVDVFRYSLAFSERGPVTLASVVQRRNRPSNLKWPEELATNTEAYSEHQKCMRMAELAQNLCQKNTAEWATETGPWNELIELGRTLWGERWAFFFLANTSAGITSKSERHNQHPKLLDHSVALCPRTRHARLRSGNRTWWREQFLDAKTIADQELVALVALTWATPTNLLALQDELAACLSSLEQDSWYRVARAVKRTLIVLRRRSEELGASDVTKVDVDAPARSVAALMLRANVDGSRALYERRIKGDLNKDEIVLERIQAEALDLARFGTPEWSPDLNTVKRCYLLGTLEPHIPIYTLKNNVEGIPRPMMEAIASSPTQFPAALLGVAEDFYRREVAARAVPVAEVAERQRWFDQPSTQKLFT